MSVDRYLTHRVTQKAYDPVTVEKKVLGDSNA